MEISQIERLELDLDTRLAQLWEQIEDIDEWTLGRVAACMRAAYGQGYIDGQSEEFGKLHRENGYKIPERRLR